MTIEEQLKAAILSKYKSIRAFTTANDIPYSTLDSALKRGISNAGIVTMLKVFTALDLDIESIQTGTIRKKKAPKPDELELDVRFQKIAKCYSNMNEEGQSRLAEQAEFLTSKYAKVYYVADVAARNGEKGKIVMTKEQADEVLRLLDSSPDDEDF